MRAGKRRAVRPRGEPTLRHLLVSTWEVTRVSACFTCVGRRARAEVGRGRSRRLLLFSFGKISFWIGGGRPTFSQPDPALGTGRLADWGLFWGAQLFSRPVPTGSRHNADTVFPVRHALRAAIAGS